MLLPPLHPLLVSRFEDRPNHLEVNHLLQPYHVDVWELAVLGLTRSLLWFIVKKLEQLLVLLLVCLHI